MVSTVFAPTCYYEYPRRYNNLFSLQPQRSFFDGFAGDIVSLLTDFDNEVMTLRPQKQPQKLTSVFHLDYQQRNDGSLEITADLPGFSKDNVSIQLEGNALILQARAVEENSDGERHDNEHDNKSAVNRVEDKSREEYDKVYGGSMLEQLRQKAEVSIFENETTNKDATKTNEPSLDQNESQSQVVDKQHMNSTVASAQKPATHVYWKERRSISGRRVIRLPKNHDASNITATMENGVLRIVVPTVQEKDTFRRSIKIE